MTGGEDKRAAPNPSGLRGSLPPSTSSEGFPPANPSGDCSVVKALEGLGVSRAKHVDPLDDANFGPLEAIFQRRKGDGPREKEPIERAALVRLTDATVVDY